MIEQVPAISTDSQHIKLTELWRLASAYFQASQAVDRASAKVRREYHDAVERDSTAISVTMPSYREYMTACSQLEIAQDALLYWVRNDFELTGIRSLK